jgi:branched-chain amino acid aminotransferase
VKYTEFPEFKEVMAAGTAAALVPIRSITRRIASSDSQSLAATVKKHPKLTVNEAAGEETVQFIADAQEDGDPICLKLLSALKGIQLGKIDDKHGWNFKISEADGKKAHVEGADGAVNGHGKEGSGVVKSLDQVD